MLSPKNKAFFSLSTIFGTVIEVDVAPSMLFYLPLQEKIVLNVFRSVIDVLPLQT